MTEKPDMIVWDWIGIIMSGRHKGGQGGQHAGGQGGQHGGGQGCRHGVDMVMMEVDTNFCCSIAKLNSTVCCRIFDRND